MRIAQVLTGKAHWIFESDEILNYLPDSEGNPAILIDITAQPEVHEGWEYNIETNTFNEPIPVVADTDEVIAEDFKFPIANEDLMEIQLLHMMITLEDIELNRNGETISRNSLGISNTIVRGWVTLVLKEKLLIDDVPKSYRELVLTELKSEN